MHMPDGSGQPERPEERQDSAAVRKGDSGALLTDVSGRAQAFCYALRQHKHQTDQGGGLGRGGVGVGVSRG